MKLSKLDWIIGNQKPGEFLPHLSRLLQMSPFRMEKPSATESIIIVLGFQTISLLSSEAASTHLKQEEKKPSAFNIKCKGWTFLPGPQAVQTSSKRWPIHYPKPSYSYSNHCHCSHCYHSTKRTISYQEGKNVSCVACMCCVFIFHQLAKLIDWIEMAVLKRQHKMRPRVWLEIF